MGPLTGIRVVELAGIGPAPFAAMLLADLGAEVIRVDRLHRNQAGLEIERGLDVTLRGRKSIAVDLTLPEGRDLILRMVEGADVLIEGFRPGVMERLGIGPQHCRQRNPRLVYGRITGYGQDGPLAQVAGHDINYLALTGALAAIGPADGKPVPPLNLLADFGGGALYLIMGVLAALIERQRSNLGQVVDAAMIDGVASMLGPFATLANAGKWTERRGANVLDSGAPYYDVYETRDGRYVAVSAIEDRFFAILRERLGLEPDWDRQRHDRDQWPKLRERMAAAFLTLTRDEWCDVMDGWDACFSPVLTMTEAANHSHNRHRELFAEVDGILQTAAAPRFDRTPASSQKSASIAGSDRDAVLRSAGLSEIEIRTLIEVEAVL